MSPEEPEWYVVGIPDGQPYTVKYQYLTTMLLNEVQKQYRRAESEAKLNHAQQQKIEAQQERIEKLEQRLSRLEGMLKNPVQAVAQNSRAYVLPQ